MNKLLLILSNITSNNVIDSAADNSGAWSGSTPMDMRPAYILGGISIVAIIIAIIYSIIKTKKNKQNN